MAHNICTDLTWFTEVRKGKTFEITFQEKESTRHLEKMEAILSQVYMVHTAGSRPHHPRSLHDQPP